MIAKRFPRPWTPLGDAGVLRRSGGPLFALALGLILSAAEPTAGRADLVIAVADVRGPTNGTGSFEISLTNTPGGPSSFDVAGFSIQLSVDLGIHFVSVDTDTTVNPYIFAGTGEASIGPDFTFSFDGFPNALFTASDTEFTFPAITLAPGAVYGLGRVVYSVDPGAYGAVSISLLSGTSLSDADGNPIRFTTTGGQITVASIPEPSTLAMTAIGLAVVVSTCTRWRRPARC